MQSGRKPFQSEKTSERLVGESLSLRDAAGRSCARVPTRERGNQDLGIANLRLAFPATRLRILYAPHQGDGR
jgi:hypothetical protein